ncbi:MAG TPA: serine hydrolase domain-containing protein [Pyrinomonadaceae bacterium]|nr:serine hydrolase domain-containing protein [Pyrinomonadaceae bacterium]HMP64739.1 serine hydrolase domain-containing protein [Pyrinomonadaceae bacterium]
MKQKIVVHSLALLFFSLLPALGVHADAVDRLVKEHMRERNVPGAAVAVLKKGKLEKLGIYGLASVEFDAPVTRDTVFEIGSVSKQMTAAGIMLLVQDGKVRLDERISAYLPNTPDTWKDVTVRHLLTHTSGIKSYTGLSGFELSRRLTMEQFIKQLSEHPLEFTPGERNIYSNSGYNLLAYIIQTQSGKPFMDFMRERIFLPLGMTRTGDRDPRYIIKKRAAGYEWRENGLSGRDGSLTDLMGAGSITSTIDDMIKWEMALRGDRFLSPESKREKWTQFTFNNGERSVYGLGWRISDVRGHRLVGHTGQTAGFGAANFRYTENDITVIVLTNLGEIGLPGPFAASIAKIYIPTMSLKAMKPFHDPDPERTGRFQEALSGRLANKPSADILSAGLIRSLSTQRARAANERLAAYGQIQRFVFAGDETIDGKQVFRYLAETGKRVFLWRFSLDEDGKITEMTLEEEEGFYRR